MNDEKTIITRLIPVVFKYILIYFLDLLTIKKKPYARIKVGNPFGRNVIKTDPSTRLIIVNEVKKLFLLYSLVNNDAINKKPDVVGMSCQRVIPIPQTSGDAHTNVATFEAREFSKIEYVKITIE
jgi:hypothetical protein